MKKRNDIKNQGDDDQLRLAVLIDADNAQPSVIEGLLAEVAKFGLASVKRIYGDWTSTSHSQWKTTLLSHSINPVQQFAYTRGKNATDSSLIIDAMDLMYTGRLDGFCLVSSDSDFTRLAQRLREEGLVVYGFGERKTPDAFVKACDKFIYTEVLRPPAGPAKTVGKVGEKKAPKKAAASAKTASEPASVNGTPRVTAERVPIELIRQAIDDSSDETGWTNLGSVGFYLTKVRPDFDPRLYGHKKLSDLLRSEGSRFQMDERPGPGGTKAIYVRTSK